MNVLAKRLLTIWVFNLSPVFIAAVFINVPTWLWIFAFTVIMLFCVLEYYIYKQEQGK